jgi:HAMP domain-containing protein
MSIRSRLLLLALVVAAGIVVITTLFATTQSSIDTIDRERSTLVVLADSIRDLSVVINSLDSSQYRNMAKKLEAASAAGSEAFDALGRVLVLPTLSPEAQEAMEVMGNMRALITEDLQGLTDQYTSLQADLERVFLESNSTTLRMFYTEDRARTPENAEVYAKIDDLITRITGMTETLAGVSDTIQGQSEVIREVTSQLATQSLGFSVVASVVILTLIVTLALVLGTSITRRVKVLEGGLAPLAQGDFSRSLVVKGSDEVAQATRTVNHLLDSLNRLLNEVVHRVEGLDAVGV